MVNVKFASKGLTYLGASLATLIVFAMALSTSNEAKGDGKDQRTAGSLPAFSAASSQQPKGVDTSQWQTARATLGDVTYTYRYPAGWSADLAWCAPGAGAKAGEGGHLPPNCISTDLLAGQKALDVGRISGTPLMVGNRAAHRQIEAAPPNVLVSRIYTVMVYDSAGQPLFGLNTQVGHDTDAATLDAITSSLDGVLQTLQVEAQR